VIQRRADIVSASVRVKVCKLSTASMGGDERFLASRREGHKVRAGTI
jgi:hypothetical protein